MQTHLRIHSHLMTNFCKKEKFLLMGNLRDVFDKNPKLWRFLPADTKFSSFPRSLLFIV